MSYIKKGFTFASVSGLADIHCASYLPENGEIKTVLQIAHGMAEHLERYEAFAEVLCDNGVAVYINDHLGHGTIIKDKNELGYFGKQDGWKNFIEDCHELTKIAKAENPDKVTTDKIVVNVIGGGTFEDGTTSKTISGVSYSAFGTYTYAIKGATADTQLEFTSPADVPSTRWFLDEICVK